MSVSKFDKWFESNQDKLTKMLNHDNYELLYVAWQAGYSAGCDSMGDVLSALSWEHNPDRSGGQFTDEEINRHQKR